RTFLTVETDKGPYRLETLIVRPAKADGPLPIALITHGKNLKSEDNRAIRADMMLPQARDFAARGWLAAPVIRRGYGQSDGVPGVSRGAAYMACENGDLVHGLDVEADDIDGALKALAARPDADGSRAIAVGQSLGGATVLAFAARRPAGLIRVVNISGGGWGAENGRSQVELRRPDPAAPGLRRARPPSHAVALFRERQPVSPRRRRSHARRLRRRRRPRRARDVSSGPARRSPPVRRLRRTREVAACARSVPGGVSDAEHQC